jgi:Holliday junction resolvasome RuvABC DNA-binding subunit
MLDAAARLLALPSRLPRLAADTEAQAKVLWALKALGYRNAELEEALARAAPDAAVLLGGAGGGGGGGGGEG